MEWIAGLDFEKIANAIIILLTGFLAAFGIRSGKKAPAPQNAASSTHMEIAGALVDSSSIKGLSGAVEGHSLALAETRATGRDVIAAVDRMVEAMEEHTRAVQSHEKEIEEHRNEMGRQRR
ncbi:hypothetical protein [Aureimonas pseudogalii]|uniref:Methylthioribose-1-phosphate isomerase n=1 Tax=Aureimonas pseudogalii TaxID=1744844 RepID=A0A7W6H4K0_9HYPH|nr:hypothetical protein [Aureimonas pseudogalii]MBB3997174.1 methylthioribose-1-phosphate isomerase [Aureimonas pseudogalii]